jgi:hypothetical protein
MRRSFPGCQAFETLLTAQARSATGISQPGLEGIIAWVRRNPRSRSIEELLHVVEGESRAKDKYVFSTKASQGLADPQVQGRIEAPDQGKLYAGYVCLRIHEGQGYEHSMVKTTTGIHCNRQAGHIQGSFDPFCQRRIPWRGVLNPVRLIREAVIVIDQGR